MLKKMLVVMSVLAMVSPAFAAWSTYHGTFNPENISSDRSVDWERDNKNMQRKAEVWNWPASYDSIPIAKINVQMEIGFWIRLDGCQNQNLKLKQVAINKYQGEIGCTAKTNVATVWSADFSAKSGVLGGWAKDYLYVDPSSFPATGSGGKSIKVKLGLKDLDLSGLTPTGSCVDIGTVTVKVKPDVRPNIFMSGCTGSGAKFGQPDYEYYAPPKP
jgi:hypothetical protein